MADEEANRELPNIDQILKDLQAKSGKKLTLSPELLRRMTDAKERATPQDAAVLCPVSDICILCDQDDRCDTCDALDWCSSVDTH